jgi:hypothetical protein
MVEQPESNGRPRLVIKRLELENFKSYAGVQHIGHFHKVRDSSSSCVADRSGTQSGRG